MYFANQRNNGVFWNYNRVLAIIGEKPIQHFPFVESCDIGCHDVTWPPSVGIAMEASQLPLLTITVIGAYKMKS